METMVMMVVVPVLQAVEGPTGGDGRPRAGDAATAMASAASRSTTRRAVAAAGSRSCCRWRNANGNNHKPDRYPRGRSTDPCHVQDLLINDLPTIRHIRTMKTRRVRLGQRIARLSQQRYGTPCSGRFDGSARGHLCIARGLTQWGGNGNRPQMDLAIG